MEIDITHVHQFKGLLIPHSFTAVTHHKRVSKHSSSPHCHFYFHFHLFLSFLLLRWAEERTWEEKKQRKLQEKGRGRGCNVRAFGGSDVCFKGPGLGGHLGMELKYKAPVKPEDAEGSKATQQQRKSCQCSTNTNWACCKGTRPTITNMFDRGRRKGVDHYRCGRETSIQQLGVKWSTSLPSAAAYRYLQVLSLVMIVLFPGQWAAVHQDLPFKHQQVRALTTKIWHNRKKKEKTCWVKVFWIGGQWPPFSLCTKWTQHTNTNLLEFINCGSSWDLVPVQ